MQIIDENNERFEQIKLILAGFTDKRTLNKLQIDWSINSDIGLEGDDAYFFIKAYADFFNVDISGFVFTDYFVEEGFDPFWIITIFTRPKNNKKPLTISHLVQAAYTKVLS